MAGVTVGIVALPLALGFGISSGMTPAEGLITAIVAGFIAAVFGGSNVQVSGPTGAMAVILLPIVASHGVGTVALVSIMAGIMVLLAGALKLGRAVGVIPWPVIEGFTLGIGVIIFLQQIPLLAAAGGLGERPVSSNAAVAAFAALQGADYGYLAWAFGAALLVIAIMVGLDRLNPNIPGSLIAIAAVTLLALVVPNPLAVIGEIPSTLPAPQLPSASLDSILTLMGPAAAVAALAAVESLLSARVAASLADTGPYHPDRELVGQGLASIGSGLFGGMPATGAIARTAVNVRAGAKTRAASALHALLLLAVVLFISRPIELVPLAALAGVLMLTAIRMISIPTARAVMTSTKSDALGFVLTAVVTVAFDLIVAVGIGVLAAGFFTVRDLSRRTRIEREPLPEEAEPGDERIALIRFDGPIIFASAERVHDTVTGRAGDIDVVILRMSSLELIDASGAHVLSEIVRTLERRGVTVLIKGVQARHEGLFDRLGVLRALRHRNHLFTDLDAAVTHARSHVRRAAVDDA